MGQSIAGNGVIHTSAGLVFVPISGRFGGKASGFAKFGGRNTFVPPAIASTATGFATIVFAVMRGSVPAKSVGRKPVSARETPFQAGFDILQIFFNRYS